MILAAAGRRIDAVGIEKPRFPLENTTEVEEAVKAFLKQQRVSTVVSSAACGADLIVLEEAGKMGLRRKVILPFEREKFQRESVDDRPGDWSELFGRIVDEIEQRGDLVILKGSEQSDPYSEVNRVVVEEAICLGEESHRLVEALMVWDGMRSDEADYTADFGDEARKHGLKVRQILTV